MKWLWFGVAALFCVAALSVWVAFQRPDFVGALITAAGAALVKAVLPKLAPKDLTPEQIDKIRQGQDPFRNRPREH